MNNENDFKYVLEDFSTVFMGANHKYEELMVHETAPLKFKEVVARVFTHEVSPEMTVAEHLMQLTENDKSYMIYRQLKVKIKLIQQKQSGKGYESKTCTFEEFMETYQQKAVAGDCFIEEIILKKLHLVSFPV
ncbi:MAG: hypothetical protein PHE02_14015 [Lachnospiraceae bacterium]|nr:hypothetical protein [Lachnospiraceae bacterium]